MAGGRFLEPTASGAKRKMCYSALVERNLSYLQRTFGAHPVREQIELFDKASAADPKTFPPLQDRIFPGNFAPVIYQSQSDRRIELMRYGTFLPESMRAKRYTNYNARLDNINSPFWQDAYLRGHGMLVVNGFFEWVQVADLLSAGEVSVAEVEKYFAAQTAKRRAKLESAGKPFRESAAEKKDLKERKIVIQFTPNNDSAMLVPVIFNRSAEGETKNFGGFAIVTGDPPEDVLAAGHDRCPLVLGDNSLDPWLLPDLGSAKSLPDLLLKHDRPRFYHRLEPAS